MTTRQAFIAAAALAIAGTAGMAGWLALDPGEVRGQNPVQSASPAASDSAVTETEAAVLPPPTEAEIAAGTSADVTPAVAAPATVPAPEWRPSARRAPQPAPPVARATRSTPAPEEHEPAPLETPREREREPARTELIVPANTVLGVRLATSASSETAEIEDRVDATVTRDVIANGRIAIPAGTKLLGSVNDVVRGGKFRETARLGVRFHTLVMDDGTRVPVRVDTIAREGKAPARASAAKIGGGAVGGAIVGGIMGGRKGALLGGAAGAGAGTAAVAAGERSVAELVDGALLSVRLMSPVTVMIERR